MRFGKRIPTVTAALLLGVPVAVAVATQTAHAGATTAPVTSTKAGLLTWSPPDCGGSDGLTCTTLNLSNTGSNQSPSLASNVDYKIVLPRSGALVGGLQIRGGHNVQIIGGEIDLTYPCSDSPSSCHGINISRSGPGEVYIEGVYIHNPDIAAATAASCPGGGTSCSTGDGIEVDENPDGVTPIPSAFPVVLQNDRIDGISGCSGGGDHADVFQPYDALNATIDIDHLTGTTNCQGMQIDPDLASGTYGVNPTYDIRNVNVDVLNNPYSGDNNRYAWWLTYGTACDSGSIRLSNVYAQEPDGTFAANSVWPETLAGGGPAGCRSSWSSPTMSFPNSPQISGTITTGRPSGGDFVPAASVGVGYVSPGYV